MEVKQNLNEQNFFTEDIRGRYPVAMKVFTEWFDKYTDGVGWTNLFGNMYFIDIPFEMQVGVIVRFVDEHNESEIHHQYFQDYYTHDLTVPEALIGWFSSFICNYDQQHNPDHLLTNPPGEEDDLPF